MDRKPVQSSNVAAVGYDESKRLLEVEFTSGSVYQYEGVPPEEHRGLVEAESVGKYFAAVIRKRYQGQRVQG